jgi:hypothetical protein
MIEIQTGLNRISVEIDANVARVIVAADAAGGLPVWVKERADDAKRRVNTMLGEALGEYLADGRDYVVSVQPWKIIDDSPTSSSFSVVVTREVVVTLLDWGDAEIGEAVLETALPEDAEMLSFGDAKLPNGTRWGYEHAGVWRRLE